MFRAASESESDVSISELNWLPDLAVLVDYPSLTILDINETAVARLGYRSVDLVGTTLTDYAEPGGSTEHDLVEALRAGETAYFDRKVRAACGTWHPYNFAARKVDGHGGLFLLVGRELEELARSDCQLADLMRLADMSDDLFVVSDERGLITYANDAVRRLYGHEDFVGRTVAEFVHEDDTGWEALQHVMRVNDRAEGRVTCKAADGSPVVLGVRTAFDRESRSWFTVQRDISAIIDNEREMGRLNDQLRIQATTDPLTGVANRHALDAQLDNTLARGDGFALLLLDMDDFKSVNDSFGHAAGDDFLCHVANRIQHGLRSTDMVARLGGDEFVVFLPGVDTKIANLVAARIIASVGQPCAVGDTSISRSCSIGIAVSEAGDLVSDIMRKADRAVYQAKSLGRNRAHALA